MELVPALAIGYLASFCSVGRWFPGGAERSEVADSKGRHKLHAGLHRACSAMISLDTRRFLTQTDAQGYSSKRVGNQKGCRETDAIPSRDQGVGRTKKYGR